MIQNEAFCILDNRNGTFSRLGFRIAVIRLVERDLDEMWRDG